MSAPDEALAFGLILATARRMVEGDRFLRSGADWIWGPQAFVGLDVSAGATLGTGAYLHYGTTVGDGAGSCATAGTAAVANFPCGNVGTSNACGVCVPTTWSGVS